MSDPAADVARGHAGPRRDAIGSALRVFFPLCLAGGCVTDAWRLPADACDRCDAVDVAAPDGADVAAPDGPSPPSCAGRPLLALAVSHDHFVCALRCDGGVWCWGANAHGQLGDGTTEARATPVPVRDLGGPATAITAGYNHACAVVGGALRCWGENTYGALGDGTRDDRPLPVTVAGLDGPVVAAAAGGLHTCALLEGGAMRCWGRNQYGALGEGTTLDRLAPRPVVALGGPTADAAAGQYSTCARGADGAVRCWGFNVFGVIGDGSVINRSAPYAVALPGAARSLSLAANHVCAALDRGAVWCWGVNTDGALGDGSLTTRTRPVAVRDLDVAAAAVAVGGRHSCAATDDGAMRCWGANERGQLGDGTATRHPAPTAVAGLDGAVALLGAGEATTCAALRDGRVRCWGANESGQLGDGSTRDASEPVTVLLPP